MDLLRFIRRDPIKARLANAKALLAAFHAKRDLAAIEDELAAARQSEALSTAPPDVRQRLAAERDVMREEARRRHSPKTIRPVTIPSEAIGLLYAAQQSIGVATSRQAVAVHAQESVLEMMQGLPWGLDTISEYRNLFAIPTLIRELYPYKATIIRTLPMLDFIRWCCRVVYEEAPVFRGLVKGKINYICRGMKCSVSPKDSKIDSRSDPVVKDAQKIIDQFIDQADYLAKRKERRRRMMIEGEAFLWIADPTDLKKDSPTACFVEPDFIRPSQRESTNQEDPHIGGQGGDDWSFGIHTPRHRYWQPLGYQIVWNDMSEQKVSVDDMFHTAVRERGNIKRCLPPAFCLLDDMIRLTLLRAALADASKFRAGIGGVIKYEEASEGAIRSWSDTVGGRSLALQDQQATVEPIDSTNYTNLISLPPGRDFVQGPDHPDASSLEQIYNWHCNAIAQAEGVPSWMVSGESANGSFASSLTAESPSIIEFEAESDVECRHDRAVLSRVLKPYIGKGLPADFFDSYELAVEPDSAISRDVKAEVETAALSVTNGFCSRQTAAAQLGYDYDREKPLMDEEAKAQALQAAALGVDPATGEAIQDTQGGEGDGTNARKTAEGETTGD